jgi:hypothetical protein
MLRLTRHRSFFASLVLGGMLLAWEGFWDGWADWLWGSAVSAVTMSDSSSGIDPNGRPNNVGTGSANSEYSSGIDPKGRP